MKYLAITLVSISIFILAHSTVLESKLANNDQILKETTERPRIFHRIKAAFKRQTRKIAKRPVAHKAKLITVTKPTNVFHCQALDGCDKGKCSVNLLPGQNKPLSCNCSKCLPNWKQVCVSKKNCHCEKSCAVPVKPTGCVKSRQISNFFTSWKNGKCSHNKALCLKHATCACWGDYEKNCKLEQCKRTEQFNKCTANLYKSVNNPTRKAHAHRPTIVRKPTRAILAHRRVHRIRHRRSI